MNAVENECGSIESRVKGNVKVKCSKIKVASGCTSNKQKGVCKVHMKKEELECKRKMLNVRVQVKWDGDRIGECEFEVKVSVKGICF